MDLETKEQFNKLNEHFGKIAENFEKINDKFEGQFGKLNGRFDRLNMFIMRHVVTRAELKETIDELKEELPSKQDINDLITRIDGYSKELKDSREEIAITGFKTNRLETWAQKAGSKIGLEYTT